MQRELIVTTCDLLYDQEDEQEHEHEPAEEVTWLLDGELMNVDMCKRHRDTVTVTLMNDIVRLFGRPYTERHPNRDSLRITRHRSGRGRTRSVRSTRVEEPETNRHEDSSNRRRTVAGLTLTGGRYACPFEGCDKTYATTNSLRVHFKKEHGARLSNWLAEQRGEELVHACTCGETFSAKRGLYSHISAATDGGHDVASSE